MHSLWRDCLAVQVHALNNMHLRPLRRGCLCYQAVIGQHWPKLERPIELLIWTL